MMRCSAALIGLFVTTSTFAEPRTVTIDDYFTQADLFEMTVSHDGKWVAYTQGEWQQSTNDRKGEVWVVSTSGERPLRLTADRAGYHDLQFSPIDSSLLYVVSGRKRAGEQQLPHDGSQQIWRLRITDETPEPVAVTRVPDGISHYAIAPDGGQLVYVTNHDADDAGDFARLKNTYSSVQYGHDKRKVSRVHALDLRSWRDRVVWDGKRYIRELALSPDGKTLAAITARDDTVLASEGESRVDLIDIASGELSTPPTDVYRADAPSPFGWLGSLAWSASSKRLAFCLIMDAHPAEVVTIDRTKDKPTVAFMPRPEGLHIRGYGSPLAFDGEKVVYLGQRRAFVAAYREGESDPLTRTGRVINDFVRADDGLLVVIENGPESFPDIFTYKTPGTAPDRLTDTNPQTRDWKLPKISTVGWTSPDGTPVEGILELPPDYKRDKPIPMIVCIHGGPTTADLAQRRYWIYGRTLFASRGYAVLCPNYRGSTGYGDAFLTDLIDHENDRDVADILSGVDAMIEKGIADPNRLGVSGWSNGGYLTNCLIARTDRFKAASSGASILDTTMEWGINDEPAYPMVFKTGLPWEKPDSYRRTSPTYNLGKVRTPTIIHVGGNDERCPPEHSRMLYRALKHYVKVPTELLIYPNEPHGLTKYAHRKAKLEWDLAWFDRYLLGKQ